MIGLNSPGELVESAKEVESVILSNYFLEPTGELTSAIEETHEKIKIVTAKNEEVKPVELIEPEPEPIVKAPSVIQNVCDTNADFASWMDYRAITNTNSSQYELQTIATTSDDGLRQINGATLIAINARYGNVGDVLTITFEDESVETVMIGDLKAHTDGCSQSAGNGRNSIIEIIVDSNLIDKSPGEIFRFSKKIIRIS